MTVSAEIHEADWSVTVETIAVAAGGYQCRIHVMHKSPNGLFEHAFTYSKTFAVEREAALEGLRTGMAWNDLKMSGTITV